MQGAWVLSLVREQDATCHNCQFACHNKESVHRNKERRSHVPQLRPGTANTHTHTQDQTPENLKEGLNSDPLVLGPTVLGLQNCFCRDLKQNQLYALIFKFWYALHVQNPAIKYNKLKHEAHCPNTVADNAPVLSPTFFQPLTSLLVVAFPSPNTYSFTFHLPSTPSTLTNGRVFSACSF